VKLTPLDVRHQQFTAALRGYSRSEVRDFLERISDQLEDTERDARGLLERVTTLEAQIEELKEGEELLRRAVVSAERIASELRVNAQREAASIVQEAESTRETVTQDALARVREIRVDIDRLRNERRLFLDQFRALLGGYMASIDRVEREDSAAVPV
jgi:cell division initiation protein